MHVLAKESISSNQHQAKGRSIPGKIQKSPANPVLYLQQTIGNNAVGKILRKVTSIGNKTGDWIQRENGDNKGVEVRSPVVEETVRQGSEAISTIMGRPLLQGEIALARSVFGDSIDYSQVRVVESDILDYSGLPNTLTVPVDFRVDVEAAAQQRHDLPTERFMHEITHIWQYQHGGTGYISEAILSYIPYYITEGRREGVYSYKIIPGQSFFEYPVEHQAQIVTDYFWASIRLARVDENRDIPENIKEYQDIVDSRAPLIEQLRSAIPRTEAQQVEDRTRDLMIIESPGLFGPASESPLIMRPIFQVEF